MCRVLGVSRSGYYAWWRRTESKHSQWDRQLKVEVQESFAQSRGRYGSPRIYRELKVGGHLCSEKRVARLMREEGLEARPKRAYRATTDSAHRYPMAPNLLGQHFTVAAPNEVWCSDITFVWTREGWLYLAVVIDLYSRRVIGWAVRRSLERELVCAAWQGALGARCETKLAGLLHHSDRGSQYASREYQQLLQAVRARCSMSRRGNCWDNAVAESFFATLKRELVHRQRFATRKEAELALFEYIEMFYNRQRRHSALGYLSPVTFEALHQVSKTPA
jgi:transposase InsO family protein